MTTIKEQLGLISNQIKDIEAAKIAAEKASAITISERRSIVRAQTEMQKLSTYALIRPSMETAVRNIDEKLEGLEAFERKSEDALDRFYDLLSEITSLHTEIMKELTDLEIIPNEASAEVTETVAPKSEPLFVEETNEPEEVDPFSEDTVDPEVIAQLDTIAPTALPETKDEDDLMRRLDMDADVSVEPEFAAPTKSDIKSLADFDDLDAKLARK